MQSLLYEFFHVCWHTAVDVACLVPYLYTAYLILEYIEHHTRSRMRVFLRAAHRFAPFYGAVLAPVSGCGLSAAAGNFYVTRLISLGTVVAIYLATSDEMLPMMIAAGISMRFILILLLFKIVFAAAVGFLLDFYQHKQRYQLKIKNLCMQHHCGCEQSNLWISSLIHTIKLSVFIFLISFVLNIAFALGGIEMVQTLINQNPISGIFIASLAGLIPNCAVSIGLTQLYIENVVPISVLMAGLLSNAGVGLLVFYKLAHSLKETIKVALILFVCGLIGGHLALFIFA